MNKLIAIVKKNWKYIVTAVVAFGIGTVGGPTIEELDAVNKQVSDLQVKLTDAQGKLDTANSEISELQAKVDEAAPWFNLTEAEKKAKELEAEEKQKENERKEQEAAEKAEQERIEANTKTLSTGEYTVGKNIEAGTYNCEAISGNGNFIVYGNYGSLKVNEMFGTNGQFYTKTFNNLELEDGDTISVTSGLKIKFTPVN